VRVVRFRMAGGGECEVVVRYVLNGGYAGRDSLQVQNHVRELAALGVPAPSRVPTLYPLPATLVSQESLLQVPHARTSGEAEWALVVGQGPDDLLLTAACDHTDRDLEVHGVAWSKQSAPDFLGDLAWRLEDVTDQFDGFVLRAWVRHDSTEQLIQEGTLDQLLPPSYWLSALNERGLLRPGTVLLGGTLPMIAGVDQFADVWRVEMSDSRGNVSRTEYAIEQLAPAWD
jgi:2-keto-4-pentenoate hydratase/2-oxohepta-3-ene-1,7-dioic acid hydratase in catechol pathway